MINFALSATFFYKTKDEINPDIVVKKIGYYKEICNQLLDTEKYQ